MSVEIGEEDVVIYTRDVNGMSTAAAAAVAPVEFEEGHVWGSIVAGVAIGLIVGGALAILFAPKSGTQLRTDLSSAVDDMKDRAEQAIDDLQASASDLVARSRSVLDRTRENIAQSVEAGKTAYHQTKEDLTAQLETS